MLVGPRTSWLGSRRVAPIGAYLVFSQKIEAAPAPGMALVGGSISGEEIGDRSEQN